MTNREWLESLTDKQLAAFLTAGLLVKGRYAGDIPFHTSITKVAYRYTSSIQGIEIWLSQPQEYFIAEE
jgi:hypothetical protein